MVGTFPIPLDGAVKYKKVITHYTWHTAPPKFKEPNVENASRLFFWQPLKGQMLLEFGEDSPSWSGVLPFYKSHTILQCQTLTPFIAVELVSTWACAWGPAIVLMNIAIRGHSIVTFALSGGGGVHQNLNVCKLGGGRLQGGGSCQCKCSPIIFLNWI